MSSLDTEATPTACGRPSPGYLHLDFPDAPAPEPPPEDGLSDLPQVRRLPRPSLGKQRFV